MKTIWGNRFAEKFTSDDYLMQVKTKIPTPSMQEFGWEKSQAGDREFSCCPFTCSYYVFKELLPCQAKNSAF
jgi:hypothetical protein